MGRALNAVAASVQNCGLGREECVVCPSCVQLENGGR